MENLVSGLILLSTVVVVLTLGIAAAYGTIFSILSILAPGCSESVQAAPVLAASQSLVGGD